MAKRQESIEETATIRDLMMDGRGVADAVGKTVFIDASIAGEVVRFRRQRRRKNYDEAELLEVIEASPDRVEPPCINFGICGGCSLQHLSPEAQLTAKQNSLLESLNRIGNVQPRHVIPPLSGATLGYRRRARLGAKLVDKKGRVLVGFRERRKSYVADMHSCETLVPELGRLIPLLSDLIGSLDISRQVPQIELSFGDNAYSLVFRVLQEPTTDDAARFREFGVRTDAQIWLQTGGPDTIRPLDADSDYPGLWYELPDFGLKLAFEPLDFVQVNQDMNRRMITQALELLAPTKDERILDLFCGIGNFTLPLATRSDNVIGVELDARMVRKAAANAASNNIANVAFFSADLAQADVRPDWWDNAFDSVVLDPPRIGALESLPHIAATGATKVLYISCHPGSLARDAGILTSEHGFSLTAAGAMDMFPQTSHVEAMALFER
jgi:23S rRNA (uracil1939-C5)-methyltransferase